MPAGCLTTLGDRLGRWDKAQSMASFSVLVRLFLVAGLCACVAAFYHYQDQMEEEKEKAQYHLGELQKSVTRLSILEKRSIRAKRDDHRARQGEKTDFLFNSLVDFCLRIQSFSGDNANATSDGKIGEVVPPTTWNPPVEDKVDEGWYQPEVRPTHVRAYRAGNFTHVFILVNHTIPAKVTRYTGFEVEEIALDKISEKSLISFTVDPSAYCLGQNYEYNNEFIFESLSKEQSSAFVNLRGEFCKYDLFQNESLDWENRSWERRLGPVEENVVLPKFRFDSDVKDTVTVKAGRNESIDLTVEVGGSSYFFVTAVVYDKNAKKMQQHTAQYDDYRDVVVNGPPIKGVRQFLSLQRLGSRGDRDQNETDSHERNERRKVSFRLTLITDSGQVTGRVSFFHSDRFGTYYNPRFVDFTHITREILLRKPKKKNVFPRNRVVVPKGRSFRCNEDGNMNRDQFGKNCTMNCWAFGRDIRRVTITKKNSKVPIYKSFSLHVGERIFTRIDLGTASPDIDGTYVCKVMKGKSVIKTRELELYAFGHPKILQTNETSVVDFGNGTAMVTCAAQGKPPMNISVLTRRDAGEERLDDKPTSIRTETESDNGVTTLTVELPTDELRYPTDSVQCSVSSDRGHDYHSMYVADVIQNYNAFKAKMVPEDSGIVNFGNGTTAVTCTASGHQVEVGIAIGGSSEEFRIDKEPGSARVETRTANGTSVTLFADTRNLIRSTSWLYCLATNEFDTDTHSYNLRDYIDWRLKRRPY